MLVLEVGLKSTVSYSTYCTKKKASKAKNACNVLDSRIRKQKKPALTSAMRRGTKGGGAGQMVEPRSSALKPLNLPFALLCLVWRRLPYWDDFPSEKEGASSMRFATNEAQMSVECKGRSYHGLEPRADPTVRGESIS